MSADYCPKGDTSGSPYDGKCEKISSTISTSTGAQSLINTKEVSVTPRHGLFA